MEQTIETLLDDFAAGRMTRRQLITQLALAASLAAPASTLAQSAAARAPWTTVHLDHISYAVNDYKKSAEFYASLMGWEVVNDNGKNQVSMRMGEVGQIIIRNARRPEGAPAPSTPSGQPGRPPITGVVNHISFGVSPWDTEAVKAELTRRGLNPREDNVGDDFKSWHVLDPDGWDLQISNRTGR